jgi:hypothetical protein
MINSNKSNQLSLYQRYSNYNTDIYCCFALGGVLRMKSGGMQGLACCHMHPHYIEDDSGSFWTGSREPENITGGIMCVKAWPVWPVTSTQKPHCHVLEFQASFQLTVHEQIDNVLATISPSPGACVSPVARDLACNSTGSRFSHFGGEVTERTLHVQSVYNVNKPVTTICMIFISFFIYIFTTGSPETDWTGPVNR